MWPFNAKTPKKKVEEMARRTFAIDVHEILRNSSTDAESSALVNGLEVFAALFYGCNRALAVLENVEQRALAKDHLTSHLLSEISSDYSADEMKNLVFPLLEKRFSEYDRMLDKEGDPGIRLLRCANSMLDNFLLDSIEPEAKMKAAIILADAVLIDPARRLRQML